MDFETSSATHPDIRRSTSGFTLIEAIVSLGVMAIVLVGLLGLFEFNSRVARAQVNVAEMQQALRAAQSNMSRQIRTAGRGNLPAFAGAYQLPDGVAVAVQNNVPDGTTIDGASGPEVVAGTDVLTIRGVFDSPMYQISTASDGKIPNTGMGQITVRAISPTGIKQDLQPLKDAISSGRPEAVQLVSALDDSIQAVVELTGSSQINDDNVVLDYTITGTYGPQYIALSGGAFPDTLNTVTSLGLLEEYRYYIRKNETGPVLSRARFYPGTEQAYAGDTANLRQDIADNILDLQVALGIDRNNNETIEDTGDATDDWLFNSPADSSGGGPDPTQWNGDTKPLYYVRIDTLARTDHIDPKYVSPPIQAIEDHVYDEPAVPSSSSGLERAYRRRLLRTVVDLRNVS
jgi:type II secretory pathway pseudopilin PulG